MDLKDFIADVISEIQDGIIEAIRRHDKRGAPGRINPKFHEDDWKSLVQNVDFDIAITATDKRSGEGEGKLQVYFFNTSGTLSKSNENSTTNRIKFTIPVSFPSHTVSPEISRERAPAEDKPREST
jgi:hypothetical protein